VQWRSFALLSELARRRELTDERQRYHASMRTLIERTADEAGGSSFASALRATAERLETRPDAVY
jgi:hypothetical protein